MSDQLISSDALLKEQAIQQKISADQFRSMAQQSPSSTTGEVIEASAIIAGVFIQNSERGELPSLDEACSQLEQFSLGHTRTIASLCCLLASGLTTKDASLMCGVSPKIVRIWQQLPSFRAAVQAAFDANAKQIMSHALFDKQRRAVRLAARADRLDEAIELRAVRAMEDPDAPEEAHTGLFEQNYVVNSRTGEMYPIWKFDAAIAREMREVEKQAALELGQWQDQSTVVNNIKLYGNIDVNSVLGNNIDRSSEPIIIQNEE